MVALINDKFSKSDKPPPVVQLEVVERRIMLRNTELESWRAHGNPTRLFSIDERELLLTDLVVDLNLARHLQTVLYLEAMQAWTKLRNLGIAFVLVLCVVVIFMGATS